jgi:hypothetical protein
MVKTKTDAKEININLNLGNIKESKGEQKAKKAKKTRKPKTTKDLQKVSLGTNKRKPWSAYSFSYPTWQTPITVPQPATDTTAIVNLLNKFNKLEQNQNKLLEFKELPQLTLKNEEKEINKNIVLNPIPINTNIEDERLVDIGDRILELRTTRKKKEQPTIIINYPESEQTESIEKATMPNLGRNWFENSQKLPIVYKSDIVELNDKEKSNNALNDLVTHQKKTENLIVNIGANEFNDEREIERQVEQMTQEMQEKIDKENEEKEKIIKQEAYKRLMDFRSIINDNAISFPEQSRAQLNKMSLSEKDKYMISKEQLKKINKYLITLNSKPLNSKYWTKLKNDFDILAPRLLEESL